MKWVLRGIVGIVALLAAAFVALQVWFASQVGPVEPFQQTAAELERLAFYQQPESWFVEHNAGSEIVDGQRLDPKLQYMLAEARAGRDHFTMAAPIIFSTPWGRNYIRHDIDRAWTLYAKETAPMAAVETVSIEGRHGPIQLRIYRPQTDEGPLPVLVYAHGGGWIFASLASTDRVARLLANQARVIVVSVGYRLAPEHRYPAASDDGEDAYLWTREHAETFGGDPARLGVGGDSAGGHISINIAQRQIAEGRPPPAAMLLFYPGAGLPQRDRSYELFGEGYMLDSAFIEFILPRVFEDYSPGRESEADGFMDPAGAAADLSAMPPTIVATAGFDILRDVGRRYADRLREDGVVVRYSNYGSLTHSFLQMTGVIEDADRAAEESARAFGALIRAP